MGSIKLNEKQYFIIQFLNLLDLDFLHIFFPQNHTSDLVAINLFCGTSPVVYINNNTGEFHTLNSIYKPIDKKQLTLLKRIQSS